MVLSRQWRTRFPSSSGKILEYQVQLWWKTGTVTSFSLDLRYWSCTTSTVSTLIAIHGSIRLKKPTPIECSSLMLFVLTPPLLFHACLVVLNSYILWLNCEDSWSHFIWFWRGLMALVVMIHIYRWNYDMNVFGCRAIYRARRRRLWKTSDERSCWVWEEMEEGRGRSGNGYMTMTVTMTSENRIRARIMSGLC